MKNKIAIMIILLSLATSSAFSQVSEEEAYQSGRKAMDEHRFEAAIDAFTAAIEANGWSARAYIGRGIAYTIMDDDRALADFNQSLKLEKSPQAYNNRANLHANRGDFLSAIADYDRALAMDPNYVSVYNNRARAYLEVGSYDRAWEDVRATEALGVPVSPKILAALEAVSDKPPKK